MTEEIGKVRAGRIERRRVLALEIPRPEAGKLTASIVVPHRGHYLVVHAVVTERALADEGLGRMLLYHLEEGVRRARARSG